LTSSKIECVALTWHRPTAFAAQPRGLEIQPAASSSWTTTSLSCCSTSEIVIFD